MTDNKQQDQAAMPRIRAVIKQNTFNREKRTIDVVFATENPVQRYDWCNETWYNEVLSCKPESVRAARMRNGLPVFDNHIYDKSTINQLGICDNIRFEKNEMVGTITLGSRADDALISDIENGIVRGISVGYNVYSFTREPMTTGQSMPTYTATDWEPMEISFAPVAADTKSGIRSQNSTIVIINRSNNMLRKFQSIDDIKKDGTREELGRLYDVTLIARSANLDDAKVMEMYNDLDKSIEQIRAACPGTASHTPDTLHENAPSVDDIRDAATKSQNERLDAILISTRKAKLDDSMAIDYFKSDKSLDQIRHAIIEEFAKGDPKATNMRATTGETGVEKKRAAIEQAILARVSPNVFKGEKAEGNHFRGYSLMEMQKELLQERGVSIAGLSKNDIAHLAFSKRDLSTSDFPLLLENVTNRLLRGDYAFAPEYWDKIARQTTVNDFRKKSMYQVDSKNGMDEVPEGDEIKYTKLVESKQTIGVKSFAEGIKFTRQAMINDDLSAFQIIPSRFALDWNTKRGDLVWGMITGNVKMDDGKELFHSSHANLATTAAVIADTSLEAALIAFKAQKGIDGERKIRVVPKYLIVSSEYEITARKLLTIVAPTQASQVNVFSSMGLEIIVEPRLSGKAWYLTTDPNAIDGLYFAYLDGNEGLRSSRVEDFDTDSIKFAVRGEFGVSAVDYRGWYKNAGQ